MQILCHNFPEASILEIRVNSDGDSLAQKLSLPWHRVLDWETAAWTGDDIQYSSTAAGKNFSDSQVDVIILRDLPPSRELDEFLTKITDKLDKKGPLGFICITSSIHIADEFLRERNGKALLSIHDPQTGYGILVVKAIGKESASAPSKLSSGGSAVILHSNQPCALEASVTGHLQKQLQQIGINTAISKWKDVSNIPDNAHVISLVEVSNAVIETLDVGDFAKVKTLVSKTSEILWVTSETTEGIPIRGAVDGFSRSLKSEEARVLFRVAHFGRRIEADAAKMAGVIVRLAINNKTRDHEFKIKLLGNDLVAFTSRVAQDETLSDYVQKRGGDYKRGPCIV